MDHRFASLIAAALLAMAGHASAGYAEAAPPDGWSRPTAEAPSGMFNRAAANSPWVNGSAAGSVRTSVGGQAVTMPARMRMAQNAGRFVGRFAGANPWLLLLGVGLPLTLDWLESRGFFLNEDTGTWEEAGSGEPGWDCNYSVSPSFANPAQFCANNNRTGGSILFIGYSGSYCQARIVCDGGFQSSIGNIPRTGETEPPRTAITPQQLEEKLATAPVPDAVANEVPTPLPIEQPAINPGPAPEYLPSTWRVPVGQPQPVPDTSPQKYKQPVVDVVPAPAPGQPWRIDLQPKDVVSEDPAGQTEGQPASEAPQGTVTPKEQQDFCSANPQAAMCQELDEPEDVEMPEREVSLSITADGGWGAEDAACPAPRVLSTAGGSIEIPYDLFCMFFRGIRPVVIAVAWLIAALMVLGAVRGNE